MTRSRWTLLICAGVLSTVILPTSQMHCSAAEPNSTIIYHESSFQSILFAVQEIQSALEEKNFIAIKKSLRELRMNAENSRIIILSARAFREVEKVAAGEGVRPEPLLPEQGYAIRQTARGACWVIGSDEAGAMYGGLYVAERIRLYNGLESLDNASCAPSIVRRGIKFNIPLDARTPSYDDTGDAAQNNYAEMWNFDFWKEFLDDMARYRYNTLTLWNPHPFPSIVKLPNYPDAALDDICVSAVAPTYERGKWGDPQLVTPFVLDNLKVVKKMSIDEKIAFWRRVMQYAKDRCIDIYFITWNVVVNSVDGKYGITTAQDNPNTIAYMRECVRETILTYPLLTGIGITAGENMRDRNDEFAREKWIWNTYGLGIFDAKQSQPGRTVRFIHRVWNTGMPDIMKEFASKYPDPFEIGFKYSRAHMYSSTKPPFADELLKEMEPYDVKCWWNLRNDDIFNFRWGNPEYVREFLANLPTGDKTAGYHMGSDGYVWGREFTSLEPQNPRQLEMRKHWYSFMLWGRLGYDLHLSTDFFKNALHDRFPEADADALYNTWATVSKIIPLVNRFHWRDWDFQWAVEGCIDQQKGFHTVQDFIETPPMEGSGMVSIPEYADNVLTGKSMDGITPPQVAAELQNYSQTTLEQLKVLRARTENIGKELRLTLTDMEAMAHLGNYYSSKISGAVGLCLYEKSKNADHKDSAVHRLNEGIKHWEHYASVASRLYRPQLLARTRMLDWWKIWEEVKKDAELAQKY